MRRILSLSHAKCLNTVSHAKRLNTLYLGLFCRPPPFHHQFVPPGVVLRVDSPGGDALASDLMWREIRQLAAKKPVVACMGDVAASGGYYLSMAAQVSKGEGEGCRCVCVGVWVVVGGGVGG